MYEKQRFHDLKVRESLFKEILSIQKQIQTISIQISTQSTLLTNLTNALEVKMNKKDCLELLLGELIFQMDRFGNRLQEAEKINFAVSQAQTLAAKKAKVNRISGLKGSMLSTNAGRAGSNVSMNK